MFKKTMLVAAAVAALFAIGVQAASAHWYDEGVALGAGENPKLSFEGGMAFSGANGGIACSTGMFGEMEATGGSTEGHLLKFGVTNATSCEISGGLVFPAAGTTTLKNITLTGSPKAVNNAGNDLQITGITVHCEFHNGFKLTLTSIAGSPVTGEVDSKTAITKVSLSGKLNSAFGEMTLSGTPSVVGSNSGTYGLVS